MQLMPPRLMPILLSPIAVALSDKISGGESDFVVIAESAQHRAWRVHDALLEGGAFPFSGVRACVRGACQAGCTLVGAALSLVGTTHALTAFGAHQHSWQMVGGQCQ